MGGGVRERGIAPLFPCGSHSPGGFVKRRLSNTIAKELITFKQEWIFPEPP